MASSSDTPKAGSAGSAGSAASTHSLVPVGSAVQIVQVGDAFCHQHGVVVGVKGGGWYDVKLDVSGAVQKYRPGMFVFSNPDLQQAYLQRSRRSPKSAPMPSPIVPPSAASPVLAPLQQQLCNLGIRYASPSTASSAVTPHMAGGAAVLPPPLLLDDDVSPKFIKGTNIMLQPPPLMIRGDECESLYTKGCPIRVVDFGDVNQNRTGITLGCMPSGWVRIKLDAHPPAPGADTPQDQLPSVVLYRFDAIRPLSMCVHPVCSPADVQRLGSAGLQLLTSTQEEALPRTTSPELRSPHAGIRRTRDKGASSRSPFPRQAAKDRAYFLGDGNGSPMSASSRGIPIDGLSVGNLSDSDLSSGDNWSPGSGSEGDMHDTAKLLYSVALQHSGASFTKENMAGSSMEESDEGGHAKRRSRTYGVFDRGTRVVVTDAKFVQEHGAGCRGTIVFFKGGGWYFLRMDMDAGATVANGGVVMFRPSSFHVIEGRGEVSADDIALAEEKSGITTVFPNGTRISIIGPNTKGQADDPTGREGCIVDYKGGGWYFIKLDGVDAVTMSRKGSFVVLSLPPESETLTAFAKSAAADTHSRRLKDAAAMSRAAHVHAHKTKLSPPSHVDDHTSPSSSSRPSTFSQAVGSAASKTPFKGGGDGDADDGSGALGALLSIAMGADATPVKSGLGLSSHVSPATCTPPSALPSSRHDVTSYASFEFRGTPTSPTTSPHLKPVPSPHLVPRTSVSEWQKPFTAPVLPVSASPLMQPASSPVIAALAQQGSSMPGPPLLSLSSSALPSAQRAGGSCSHALLHQGLPPLPPSTKQQGLLHKPSSSNVASSSSHVVRAAATTGSPSGACDVVNGEASA